MQMNFIKNLGPQRKKWLIMVKWRKVSKEHDFHRIGRERTINCSTVLSRCISFVYLCGIGILASTSFEQ